MILRLVAYIAFNIFLVHLLVLPMLAQILKTTNNWFIFLAVFAVIGKLLLALIIVVTIYAAIKAYTGQIYSYPFTIRFLR